MIESPVQFWLGPHIRLMPTGGSSVQAVLAGGAGGFWELRSFLIFPELTKYPYCSTLTIMRLFNYFVLLIAVISVALNFILLRPRQRPREVTYKVLEVIDGDTFKIDTGKETRRVRLMGVNTPEEEKCLGIDAKETLTGMVLGKKVVLEDQFSDPYGRIMANVFVEDIFVNKEMLLLGLGRMDYYENPQREELKAAYGEARSKRQGIFSGICLSKTPPVSPDFGIDCLIKGNIDDNTQKKVYFLPSCRNYSQVTIDLSADDSWFCFEEEALKMGFMKSKTCD